MKGWAIKPLEFEEIKQLIKAEASSSLGIEKIEELVPSNNYKWVQSQLEATQEGLDLIRLKGHASLQGVRNIRHSIEKAKVGSILSPSELLDIADTVIGGRKIKGLFRQVEEKVAVLPILRGLTDQLFGLEHIDDEIILCIDDNGVIKDSASHTLQNTRNQMLQKKEQINQILQRLVRNQQVLKMLQEPVITQRQGRYVLPVKHEYRGSFAGIIHDQSASGATLFIEPDSTVQINNQLRELELVEEREIEKILRKLTELITLHVNDLESNTELLAEIDFIFAKANYGTRTKSIVPRLSADQTLKLKSARHPLIPQEKVVPIDVQIIPPQQAVIITGPNTGGKTVSLKTIGLCALMVQSGLPIPVEEGSQLPVYQGIFADIGDEQSIHQNLSTFSSHLTNIIGILSRKNQDSLLLFDELGAGTDPTEGAALAMGILEEVLSQGCSVVATTHYSELKWFAHQHSSTINASVEFDISTLSPTYRLLMGVPGKSNALAISEKLGLSDHILSRARKFLSGDQVHLSDVITSISDDQQKAQVLRQEAQTLREQWAFKHKELEEHSDQILSEAKEEARKIVAKASKEADELLKQLREWIREKPSKIKEHQLSEGKKRLENAYPKEIQFKAPLSTPDLLEVGDTVFIPSLKQEGIILEKYDINTFQVQVGPIKTKLKSNQLEKKSKPRPIVQSAPSFMKRTREDVKPELDLRGKMIEEAIVEIEQYLDRSIMAGYTQISLIHGKGTGALRSGVQKFLKLHRNVKDFRLGSHGEGGAGVTIVELK